MDSLLKGHKRIVSETKNWSNYLIRLMLERFSRELRTRIREFFGRHFFSVSVLYFFWNCELKYIVFLKEIDSRKL
jgi:hypothetical protein